MQTTEKIKPCFPLFRDDDYKSLIANKREQFEETHPKDKVDETFEWTTTKEYQVINFKREALTINPAKVFGLADQVGSLEPGKDADLVIWTADPFEPLSQPTAIFIRGQAQPLTSRQIELRDRYKDLSGPYPVAYPR